MNSRIKEDVHKIFEFWCEVTKTENSSKQTGVIIESFPENYRDDQVLTKIPDFAYPCQFENERVQSYSFVLTSDDSKWRFGFCRHDPKTQTAMIVITYLPWHDTFLRFLNVLAELRRNKNGEFEIFLSEAYNKGVPEAGASLTLFFNGGNFTFQRPSQFKLPSIPENHNLNLYYNFVEPKSMILIFASMLSERRIIFTSSNLEKLSSCIQAANAFLYPMVWQHIFIPILPMKLKDILSAPMPFLIGVPEGVLQTMTPEELGEVVIYNCDSKQFDSPFDDIKQMPPEIISQMKKQLNNPNEHMGDRVSKIFLGVLVQLIGGYRDAVRFSSGKKITWDKDAFIESRPQHLRSFLASMMELQIFQQFIDERLDMLNEGLGFSDEFELETLRYSEKMGKRGRNYKEFLKNVKDKTNPAMKNAVKSVKESSKGVKTAYKDLKSKLRDSTPPKSQFHISNSFSGTSNNAPRSAPNSPVFGKRHNHLEFTNTMSTSGNHNAQQLLPSVTSNSLIQDNSYLNLSNTSNLLNNNNYLSPAISPSVSLASSDMNLSQELQNHPLFKSPTVNRNLKPSNSLDPNQRTSNHSASSRLQIIKNSSSPPPPLPQNPPPEFDVGTTFGNLCIIDLDDSSIRKNNQSQITKSIFDVPPDMPSPPVPPRRTNNKINSKTHLNGRNEDKDLIIGFENNFDNNPANTEKQQCNVPIPAPRHKIKELSTNKLENSNENATDLITLNDSNNTSFDIEDFDPLNQNAKPIPTSFTKLSTSSTPNTSTFLSGNSTNSSGIGSTLSSNNDSINNLLIPTNISTNSNYFPSTSAANYGRTIPSVHNPIYPYFTPINQTYNSNLTTQQKLNISKSDNKEDDFELLRKYGLEQLTLKNINNSLNISNNPNIKTENVFDNTNNINPNNWTTFD